MILAIDPGNEESAWVLYDGERPVLFAKQANEVVLQSLRRSCEGYAEPFPCNATVAIEMIASYGMPVGREVFETCVWIGRFIEAWGRPCDLVYRKDVKLHLCGQPRAKDANIRQALLDRYGGKEKAVGRKAAPGPLYGIAADVWSALAIAVTRAEVTHAAL